MKFIPSLEIIRPALEGGYAVPSFSVWNAESMAAVLRVASDCRSPVMLMSGPCEFSLLPPSRMADVARAVAKEFRVKAALHLDHGDSLDCVKQCLAAGFTSVMLDYSTRPVAENIAAMRQVVELARPKGITVEGEIGAVGRVDDATGEGAKVSTLTDPDEAREFVRRTGIDMVAVSIGNAHGNYTVLPTFDFELMKKLRDVAGIPLVLHGGSGTPPEDIRRSIRLGVAKINIATDLVRAYRETLNERWKTNPSLWLPMVAGRACTAVTSSGVTEAARQALPVVAARRPAARLMHHLRQQDMKELRVRV